MNNFTGNKTRRSNVDIIITILRVILTEKPRRTHIMYKANLNFAQLKRYLNYLILNGLIVENNNNGKRTYQLTTKGRKLLEAYDEIIELLEC